MSASFVLIGPPPHVFPVGVGPDIHPTYIPNPEVLILRTVDLSSCFFGSWMFLDKL